MDTLFLSDLIDFSRDGEWGEETSFDGSIKMAVIRGTDFDAVRQGDTSSVPIRFIQKHIAEYKRLHGGEILLETAGGSKNRITGRTIFLKPLTVCIFSVPVTCASFSRFIRLKKSDIYDTQYVFWLLQYLYHFGYMDKYHTQHTGVSRFQWTTFAENEPLSFPAITIQRKIAAILSAYDDLIENNLRRIKILEEMAQALYREWFVHFRFPGHEKVRLVDSPLGKIPEGWEASTLDDNIVALESGRRPKGGVTGIAEGIPSIGAENVFGIGKHDFPKERYVPHEFFDSLNKGVVKDGDVALYKDGANIGRSTYFRDGYPYQKCCVNEHVFLIRATGDHLTQNMLYLWLREPETVAQIRSKNTNAAQPGINQKAVRSLRIVVPPKYVVNEFDSLVESILGEIVYLANKNRVLQCTRDLLLPKLISGELDVSELDIAVPEDDPSLRSG